MSGTHLKAVVLAGVAVLAMALGGLSRHAAETQAAPVPELKAKGPTAELDRVRVDKLGAALACPTVREQLKITAEQDKKLDEAWAEASTGIRAAIQRQKGAVQQNEDAILDLFNGLDDTAIAFDTKAMKVLTVEQLTRLRQVQLQRDGAAALLSRHAVRVLKLTPDQEDRIAGEVAKSRGTGSLMVMIELQASSDDPRMSALIDGIRRKQAAEFDDVMKAAVKNLTAEQKKAWADLTGAPIPSVELIRAATAFSDPKFAKLLKGDPQPPQLVQPPPVAAPPPPPVEKKK